MRIGIDIRELEVGKKTGIGRYLLNFLSYVSENDKENQYILLGNQKTSYSCSATNIKVKIIPEFSKLYFDQVVLSGQMRKEALDLFFSPYFKSPIFSSTKRIATVHDVYPFWSMQFDSPMVNLPRKVFYKLMFYSADLIITVSEYIKQAVLRVVNINPDKIKVVYNCVGEGFMVLDKEECRDRVGDIFGIKKDFILYVGNMKPHKNLKNLIQAYNSLRPEIKDRYLLVFAGGKDKFYPNLLQFIKDFKLEKEVLFTGLVEDKDLVLLYNAATLFVSVSLYEGFGLPLIEAMACGTPVIAGNATAQPEVVADAGIVVNPLDSRQIAEAIEMVLTDSSLRSSMAEKGLTRARDFSQTEMVNRILGIFKQVYKTQEIYPAKGFSIMPLFKCNLCGSDEVGELFIKDATSIVRCSQCGLVCVYPMLSSEELGKVYDKGYFDGSQNIDYFTESKLYLQRFEEKLNKIEHLLKDRGRLLDLGCAFGYFLTVAKKRGWQVYGTDISPFAAQKAKEITKEIFVGTLEQAGYQSESFDVITMWHIIEHLKDPQATIKEISRILKPGALLVVETPNFASRQASLQGKDWEFIRPREHLYYFTEATLGRMLKENGFDIVAVEKFPAGTGMGKNLNKRGLVWLKNMLIGFYRYLSWVKKILYKFSAEDDVLLVYAKKLKDI